MSRSTRPGRVAITLTAGERDVLRGLAHRSHEPQGTTAARLLRAGLANNGATLDAALGKPTARPPRPEPTSDRGPDWLPPAHYADAVDALRRRYPHELRYLPDDALTDTLLAEQLAALAHWRQALDQGDHDDPRMELAVGHELRDLANWLQQRARRSR